MKTIAIINQKGGVGKSTIAVNLAYELARQDISFKHSLIIYINNFSL